MRISMTKLEFEKNMHSESEVFLYEDILLIVLLTRLVILACSKGKKLFPSLRYRPRETFRNERPLFRFCILRSLRPRTSCAKLG